MLPCSIISFPSLLFYQPINNYLLHIKTVPLLKTCHYQRKQQQTIFCYFKHFSWRVCTHRSMRMRVHTHTHTQNTTDQYTWISKQVIHSPRQNSGYKMNKLNMKTIRPRFQIKFKAFNSK
jgi:hypothetical protein